jgi:hypothetical protein
MSVAEPVDALLQEAARLLGTGPPPSVTSPAPPGPPPPHPQWEGNASAQARLVSTQLTGRLNQLYAAGTKTANLINSAAAITTDARTQIASIQSQWERDKAAVGMFSNTSQGQAALAAAGQARVQEATGVVADAANRFGAKAQGVRAAQGELPRGTKPGGQQRPNGFIQAAGFGPVPEAPPRFPLPETPWEYNIDITSNVETGGFSYPGVHNAGQISSIDDVWNELHRCFNCNFPIGGAPRGFPKVGDELPLEMRIAGQKLANLPVKVTQIERTATDIDIEFATLPGHVDGSTIHFHFFQQGGQRHLGIRGYITDGPGSEDIPILSPTLRTGYTEIAQGTWQPTWTGSPATSPKRKAYPPTAEPTSTHEEHHAQH